jgi:hypothetical protein
MVMLSEECELPLFHVDALASLVEVFLVQFKSDKVAFLLDASDGGRAAANEGVENYPPHFGACQYKPSY